MLLRNVIKIVNSVWWLCTSSADAPLRHHQAKQKPSLLPQTKTGRKRRRINGERRVAVVGMRQLRNQVERSVRRHRHHQQPTRLDTSEGEELEEIIALTALT